MNGVIYNPVVIIVPHSVTLINYAFCPMPRIKNNGISGHYKFAKTHGVSILTPCVRR
jgi:hypothetical protein